MKFDPLSSIVLVLKHVVAIGHVEDTVEAIELCALL